MDCSTSILSNELDSEIVTELKHYIKFSKNVDINTGSGLFKIPLQWELIYSQISGLGVMSMEDRGKGVDQEGTEGTMLPLPSCPPPNLRQSQPHWSHQPHPTHQVHDVLSQIRDMI